MTIIADVEPGAGHKKHNIIITQWWEKTIM